MASSNYKYVKEFAERRRLRAIEYLGGVCTVCGTTEKLHIAYIDLDTKSFIIHRNWCRKWEILEPELNKCRLLCERHHTEVLRDDGEHGQKLTMSQVEELRAIYAEGGLTQKDLGKRYGISQGIVSKIINGRSYKVG